MPRAAAEQCERSEANRRMHRRHLLKEFIRLYEAWESAEPGQGYAEKAAEWRAKLPVAAPQPASAPAPTEPNGP